MTLPFPCVSLNVLIFSYSFNYFCMWGAVLSHAAVLVLLPNSTLPLDGCIYLNISHVLQTQDVQSWTKPLSSTVFTFSIWQPPMTEPSNWEHNSLFPSSRDCFISTSWRFCLIKIFSSSSVTCTISYHYELLNMAGKTLHIYLQPPGELYYSQLIYAKCCC